MSPSPDKHPNRGNFLESSLKLFRYYQSLGEKAIAQLTDEEVMRKPNEESNSIALIVHHLSGNMRSRFTDFMTTDGEKPWRDREKEFSEAFTDKAAMMTAWSSGWECVYTALEPLRESDLSTIIYIRNEGQTVLEAIQRQLAHYASHIGQIIYQAKVIKGSQFQSLSIPKGGSTAFNDAKFSQEKTRRHFTEGLK
jgi:hypothetical protein